MISCWKWLFTSRCPVTPGKQTPIGRVGISAGCHKRTSAAPNSLATAIATASVPVMIRLVRAFLLDADIVGLVLAQLGELHADLGEVQAGDLLVQRLR